MRTLGSIIDNKGKKAQTGEEDKTTGPSARKEKRTRWITRAMADDFGRYEVLYTTFRELALYLVFVIAVSICTIGTRLRLMYYQTQAIKAQFIEKEFDTVNGMTISFLNIKTSADFWFFTEHLLMDSLYWESYYTDQDFVQVAPKEDHKVLYESILLGVPRIRQVKVRNNSCKVHQYFRKVILSCYESYSEDIEDHAPFGLRKGTAWTYSSDEKTGSITTYGTVAAYGGGGYYQNLARTKHESKEIVADLKKNLWITRGTRAVFVDFSLYNTNLNIFCICKLVFEFLPTGGVLPNYSFQPTRFVYFNLTWDYVTFGCECLVYIMAGFFLIEEIREIMYFKFRYFLQFWTYVDLTIIVMAGANFLSSLVIFPSAEPTIQRYLKEPNRYGNLEYYTAAKNLYINFAASLLFFSYIKLFKYLTFNRTMGQLNATLKNCILDIVAFSIMFFIIFFAFAELGVLLFGSQMKDFRTVGTCMFTLFRAILGAYDYDEDIEKVHKVLAPIYFMTYIFFVFFVLINMFLAIINDTYSDVKTEIALTPTVMPMSEFLTKEIYNLLRKCGCKIQYKSQNLTFNATVQQLREALKKCGFSDLEIEMFFARYHIDPLAVCSDNDYNKILAGLEGLEQAREEMENDVRRVHVSDFITQQERLDQIELTIEMIITKVDNFTRKVEVVENLLRNRAAQE